MDRLLILGLSAMQCHPMMCNDGHITMPANTCTYLNNNILYLQPCKDKNKPFCDSGSDISYCTANPVFPNELSYPGEPCDNEIRCKYGDCLEGYCQSQDYKQVCSLNEECNPGLYCKNGKCANQLSLGATGCVNDYECVNWGACIDGVCIKYFSLLPNATTTRCYSQFSELCQGGMCWQGYCIEAVQSYKSLPVSCNSYMDCTSSVSDDRVFYSDCMCGMNPQGTSYCTMFPGDPTYAHFISVLANWINSEMSDRCNTMRRLSTHCISKFWDKPNSDELFLYYYRTYYYPFLQSNDHCTREIFTDYYWNLVEDITNAKYTAISSGVLLYLIA